MIKRSPTRTPPLATLTTRGLAQVAGSDGQAPLQDPKGGGTRITLQPTVRELPPGALAWIAGGIGGAPTQDPTGGGTRITLQPDPLSPFVP